MFAQDQSTEETRFSIYGLLAQLALDGKPNVKLAYHSLTKQASNHKQLQRYAITIDREKVWVSAPYIAPALGSGGEDSSSISWTNIGKFLGNVDNLPNLYMQIAWSTNLDLQHGQAFLQFERPYLIWNRSISFKKDQYLRVA